MLGRLLQAATFAIVCIGWLLHGSCAASLPKRLQPRHESGARDLAFMHIPFNFGHTIEQVAMLEEKEQRTRKLGKLLGGRRFLFAWSFAELAVPKFIAKLFAPLASKAMDAATKENPDLWGHASPDLQEISDVTGCPMYFTPQKYWPKDLAEKYFGNKTVFGMLRDPYERMVALFRGNVPSYGGGFSTGDFLKCDVNSAIKKMMKKVRAKDAVGEKFQEKCTFLPQAEYFDGEYGITLPVNNRDFPRSMNDVFQEHGYTENVIHKHDIFHVWSCKDSWSGDLDAETKALIREHYKRDFELLCEHFGYCDDSADTCIQGVAQMCPERVLEQNIVTTEPTAKDLRIRRRWMQKKTLKRLGLKTHM